MADTVTIQRPQRWDSPFGPDMSEEDVQRIMALEPFASMDLERFPATLGLDGIISNDTRLMSYNNGDIIVRAGDYGNSAFLIVSGQVRVVLPPGLPEEMLGRAAQRRKGFVEAISQLWRNPRFPEVRDPSRYSGGTGMGTRGGQDQTYIFLQDVPAVLNEHRTAVLPAGEMFGEIAALGRTQRTATIFAEGPAVLLEIRWQGLRDIRRRVDEFRQHVDRLYRERSLASHLQATPLFSHLSDEVIEKIANETLFETYGDFDWHTSYKRLAEGGHAERLGKEPVVVAEGDYPDGLLLVRSGFGRVSRAVNNGHRTLRYIGRGSVFGMEEIIHNWKNDDNRPLQTSLRALGYTDILRVPTKIIEELVLPTLPEQTLQSLAQPTVDTSAQQETIDVKTAIDPGMLEFLVEYRYINGTATMMIDLDRCVRCDECVTACAKGHNNNPRFNRHGRRYDHYMVANACMHCQDPVCMIGCPTGAIHRSSGSGQVVINDDTCIGCATCANSCPYDNIRMVEVRDDNGAFILDEASNSAIVKASKCDLCLDQLGGPACQRACPHDALKRVDMGDMPTLASWLAR